MAKEKSELLDELKVSHHNFSFIGKVKISEDTFKGASNKEGKTWYSVNSSIGIETSPGNIVYGRVQGGYKLDDPVLRVRPKTGGDLITIPYESRGKKELLKNVSDFSFFNAGLKVNEAGKLEYHRFIDAIDFEQYLSENLEDGMEVKVSGSAEYSPGAEDKVYTNFDITSIFLNRAITKDGEEIPPKAHQAVLYQTYLADDSTLDKGWEKEFRKDGEITLQLYVPQYLSKIRNSEGVYVEWKKTSPIIQSVTFRASEMAKDVDSAIKMINKYFKIKKGVREVSFYVNVRDGYMESQMAEYEISPEMKELISMGLITEDEINAQVTVRKSRVQELVFGKPSVVLDEDGTPSLEIYDDKYTEDVLVLPSLDEEDDDDDNSSFNEEAESFTELDEEESSTEIDFDSMFN